MRTNFWIRGYRTKLRKDRTMLAGYRTSAEFYRT